MLSDIPMLGLPISLSSQTRAGGTKVISKKANRKGTNTSPSSQFQVWCMSNVTDRAKPSPPQRIFYQRRHPNDVKRRFIRQIVGCIRNAYP